MAASLHESDQETMLSDVDADASMLLPSGQRGPVVVQARGRREMAVAAMLGLMLVGVLCLTGSENRRQQLSLRPQSTVLLAAERIAGRTLDQPQAADQETSALDSVAEHWPGEGHSKQVPTLGSDVRAATEQAATTKSTTSGQAAAARPTTTPAASVARITAVAQAAPDQCYFDYNGGAANECFCQLAGNRGCEGKPCTCSEGCEGVTLGNNPTTVTFRNKAKAWHCSNNNPTALLTIPKSYFSNIAFLKTWCPAGMEKLIAEMLYDGFNAYAPIGGAPVHQCIHAATHVSISWLHLHTFCPDGSVDYMPSDSKTAWCSVMHNAQESRALAKQVMQWATNLYGPLDFKPLTNCSTMGCNTYGPAHHCSCNDKCSHYGDCCSDYQDTCRPAPPPAAFHHVHH